MSHIIRCLAIYLSFKGKRPARYSIAERAGSAKVGHIGVGRRDEAAEHRMTRTVAIFVWMSVAVLALALNVYLLDETFTVGMSPGAKYATISINVHMLQVSRFESEFQTSNDLLQIWHTLYYFTTPALITMFQLCLLRVVLRRYFGPVINRRE